MKEISANVTSQISEIDAQIVKLQAQKRELQIQQAQKPIAKAVKTQFKKFYKSLEDKKTDFRLKLEFQVIDKPQIAVEESGDIYNEPEFHTKLVSSNLKLQDYEKEAIEDSLAEHLFESESLMKMRVGDTNLQEQFDQFGIKHNLTCANLASLYRDYVNGKL